MMGRSKNPEGPFESYFNGALINRHINGAQPIDAQFFQDDDGTVYFYYGGWSNCNVAIFNDTMDGFLPLDPVNNPFVEGETQAQRDAKTFKRVLGNGTRTNNVDGYVEGSFMFKRDGKYYLTWSVGAYTGDSYGVSYGIGTNPLGPFALQNQILETDRRVGSGPGHHSNMYIEGLDIWLMMYHRRHPDTGTGMARTLCIDLMEFNEDGTIKNIVMTNGWHLYDGPDYGLVNLAREPGVTYVASSITAARPARLAFTGSVSATSRWQAGTSDPGNVQYLMIDFGEDPVTYNEIEIWFAHASGGSVVLEVSDDNVNWRAISGVIDLNAVAAEPLLRNRNVGLRIAEETSRYLRARFPSRNSNTSIYEFEVFYNPIGDALEKAIRDAEATYTEAELERYTESTVTEYENALKNAKNVAANLHASSSEKELALQFLQAAITGLELKPALPVTPPEPGEYREIVLPSFNNGASDWRTQSVHYRMDEEARAAAINTSHDFGTGDNPTNRVAPPGLENRGAIGTLVPDGGIINGAMYFNGNTWFAINNDNQTSTTGFQHHNINNISVAFWFNPDDIETTQMIYKQGQAQGGLAFRINDGRLEAAVSTIQDATTVDVILSHELQATDVGRWIHVALTFSGTARQAILYIDGAPVDSGTTSRNQITRQSTNRGAVMGAQNWGTNAFKEANATSPSLYYKGWIDDFRIYVFPIVPKIAILEIAPIVPAPGSTEVTAGTPKADVVAGLPGMISAKLTLTEEKLVPVTWECAEYDMSINGEYVFKAVIDPNSPFANSYNLPAQVTVTLTGGLTFVPVAAITGVPAEAAISSPLILTGIVEPDNAMNKDITWRVSNRGTTSAVITRVAGEYVFNATGLGTAIIKAVIENGNAPGVAYTQYFAITIRHKLVSVTSPAAISGLANGTPKTAEAFGLPDELAIMTSIGGMTVAVEWDVDGSTYDPASAHEQTFTVEGTFVLPAGILNPDGIPLSVEVSVTVVQLPPEIEVTSTGLDSLKVGEEVSGASILYTLTYGTFDEEMFDASLFTISGLPAGLTAGEAELTSATLVTIPITGTPTTHDISPAELTYALEIPVLDLKGELYLAVPTGVVTTGPVAKGDGADVSGAPVVSGDPTLTSITVEPVANAGETGQTVEYAISMVSDAPPEDNEAWQGSEVFYGLAPGTTYYVYARTKENADYNAGMAQVSKGITTRYTDAQFLAGIAANALKQGLVGVVVQDGKTVKLVFPDREIILSTNANNVNIEGEIHLGDGYYLIFDIKGNGSNVKVIEVVFRG